MSNRLRPQKLIFSSSPAIEYASNVFKNVPTILQYDDTPLIEVIQVQAAGFTTSFSIYNRDGVYIAKAKGAQLYPTEVGLKTGIKMRHPANCTVCELDGKTLFEITRKDAAALRTQAELYAPDGRFIRANEAGFPDSLISADDTFLRISGVTLMNNTFDGCRIGVHLFSGGGVAVAGGGGPTSV